MEPRSDEAQPLRVGWIMSRFPRLTETFVLYEMLEAERLGFLVDVYPLLRERAHIVHPEISVIAPRVRYTPFLSWAILKSQLHWLRRAPRRYLQTLWGVVRGTWGSPNFLAGGLATFPKVAHLAHLMEVDGVAHVHCHFANHPALAGFVIRRLAGITFSFTAHGSDIYVDRHMLRQKVAEAAFVIAVSDYGREVIVQECGPDLGEKVRVVHCGVDTDLFDPSSDPVVSPEFSILCVATLAPWKGQAQLIEACSLLQARGVPARCTLVGGAGDAKSLRALISARGLGARVHLAGWKPHPDIARLMREADVVVSPSVPMKSGKKEGIPVTLMEAMATAKPVVASDVAGVPELIEDGVSGLLVPPGDVPRLADALERLYRSPELRGRLGEAGRQKVLRDFDLASNAAEIVRQIRAVVGSGS